MDTEETSNSIEQLSCFPLLYLGHSVSCASDPITEEELFEPHSDALEVLAEHTTAVLS